MVNLPKILDYRENGNLIHAVSRRFGFPTVQHSSPLINGGNFLYYWMYAYNMNLAGKPTKVQYQKSIDMWLQEFPVLQDLTVKTQRIHSILSPWNGVAPDLFGRDFSINELEKFCRYLVESSEEFKIKLKKYSEFVDENTCVINVRRGDYYVYPHLTETYGLDNVKYLESALKEIKESVDKFIFVSDDLEWCSKNLSHLVGGNIKIYERENMFSDLAMLAVAPNLILANSTFSFWGGHIGDALLGKRTVIAPPYHFKDSDGSYNYLRFDPRWKRVNF